MLSTSVLPLESLSWNSSELMTPFVLMLALLLEHLVSWWSSASVLALESSVCRWNGLNAMSGLNAIILTITVAAHRSTILDEHEHELGEQHDYFTCGYATYTWARWSVSDGSCYGGVGFVLRLMEHV